MLQNKKILLGITGGIAAYKCVELIRRLIEQGAQVRVVMTPAASAFVTPLTLQAVSGHPVAQSLLEPEAEAAMSHIELARWADCVLIAPASADFIARLNAGMANDLLSTLCLATQAPIAIAPAMNAVMYQAAVTQANLAQLAQRQLQIWGPASGVQACGEVGPGRMLEPAELVMHVINWCQALSIEPVLRGKNVVITAGPTREAIDPVRYISNHSSGKMGYALANAARQMGANVVLISGPVTMSAPVGIKTIHVVSAQDMQAAVMDCMAACDIFVASAAVADYRCEEIFAQKMKKTASTKQLVLIKNPDILADVAALDSPPFTVGFAAETEHVVEYAREKMQRKSIDMIAANLVGVSDQGFNADNNELSVLWSDKLQLLPKTDKQTLAYQLMKIIAEQYEQKYSV